MKKKNKEKRGTDIQLEEYLVFLAKPFYRFFRVTIRGIFAQLVLKRDSILHILWALFFMKNRENIFVIWLVLIEQSEMFSKCIFQPYAIT